MGNNFVGGGNALAKTHLLVAAIFYIFIALAVMLSFRALSAFAEAVAAAAAIKKEAATKHDIREMLWRCLMIESDVAGDDTISVWEFTRLLELPSAVRSMQELGIDVGGLLDVGAFFFQGDDDRDTRLTFDEFFHMLLELRGPKANAVKHIVKMKAYIGSKMHRIEQMLVRAERQPRRGRQF